MKRVFILVLIAVMFIAAAHATETSFAVSSLTAGDVDCKKCHADTPHIIHAPKPVSCENCHGDKKSVETPQCTKCHDGPIHKVHSGKIEKGCAYCHKNIEPVHTKLATEAVCSHCHKDLVEVHGKDQSCTKCHKTPPEIVKPLKLEGMVLVCQNCHPQTSVATLHGEINNKQGCYNCHRGKSQLNGSDVPHLVHKEKASCKDCHEENGKVIVPQCTDCHDIDKLHAFNKIGTLTSALSCQICHPEETKPAKTAAVAKETVKETEIIPKSQQKEEGPEKIPGFDIMSTISGIISIIIILYITKRYEK